MGSAGDSHLLSAAGRAGRGLQGKRRPLALRCYFPESGRRALSLPPPAPAAGPTAARAARLTEGPPAGDHGATPPLSAPPRPLHEPRPGSVGRRTSERHRRRLQRLRHNPRPKGGGGAGKQGCRLRFHARQEAEGEATDGAAAAAAAGAPQPSPSSPSRPNMAAAGDPERSRAAGGGGGGCRQQLSGGGGGGEAAGLARRGGGG